MSQIAHYPVLSLHRMQPCRMAVLKFRMLSFHLVDYMFHRLQYQQKFLFRLELKKRLAFFLKAVLLRHHRDLLNR
jgi:hypothetical protein